MSSTSEPQHPDLGPDRANACRIYDRLIGGGRASLSEQDQAALARLLEVAPGTPYVARDNRAFMRRVTRYLAETARVDQFLDLGCGYPTERNLHEIAREYVPDARVVYVDREQEAVAEYLRLLSGDLNATAVTAPIEAPEKVLADERVNRVIDFGRPVAVLATGVFPFIPDSADPRGIVAAYRDACVPGSYLAISHALTAEYWEAGLAEVVLDLYRTRAQAMYPRRLEEVAALFEGYTMVEPGLVSTPTWRPDGPLAPEQTAHVRAVAGLGVLEVAGGHA
ncbi:MAG: SAM-dependent methyltransferase [Microbispora sp.]|nr:SAM-dependent methyltransferase [Microbispora sp.]